MYGYESARYALTNPAPHVRHTLTRRNQIVNPHKICRAGGDRGRATDGDRDATNRVLTAVEYGHIYCVVFLS
jgi:hypothetical protein